MLEWNKCIDKFMNYDSTMIVQSSKFSPTLGDELEEFAENEELSPTERFLHLPRHLCLTATQISRKPTAWKT